METTIVLGLLLFGFGYSFGRYVNDSSKDKRFNKMYNIMSNLLAKREGELFKAKQELFEHKLRVRIKLNKDND
jgi:hypothetical protein